MTRQGGYLLAQEVQRTVSPVAFYSRYFTPFDINKNQICPFHVDTKPSLSISKEGLFYCHSAKCGAKGNMVQFYMKFHGEKSYWKAAKTVYETHNRGIPKDKIKEWRMALLKKQDVLLKLTHGRGISEKVIGRYNLGWCENTGRILIPVHDRWGVYKSTVTWDIMNTGRIGKIAARYEGGGVKGLWPMTVIGKRTNTVLYFCEGHVDTMVALSYGLPAFTIGGASNKLGPEDLQWLNGKSIVICYDTDEAGRKGAAHIANALIDTKTCIAVKDIILPLKKGHKDISDYFREEQHTLKDFIKLVESHKWIMATKHRTQASFCVQGIDEEKTPFIDLPKILSEDNILKEFCTEGTIIGKEERSMGIPKRMVVECRKHEKKCQRLDCPLAIESDRKLTIDIELNDSDILYFLDNRRSQEMYVRNRLGIYKGCPIIITILELYKTRLISVGTSVKYRGGEAEDIESSQVQAFVFEGKTDKLIESKKYVFTGYITLDPKSSEMVAIFTGAKRLDVGKVKFHHTKEVYNILKEFIVTDEEDLWEYFMSLYNAFGRTITLIKERPLAHMAIDLVFHSPMSYHFGNDYIRKGALNAIVFGDRRTGKSQISTKLMRYYGHGTWVTGENITKMGLVGGIERIDGRANVIMWGVIPINHEDTIVIDEFSQIDKTILDELKTIMSDGIARVVKGGRDGATDAITGIICLSNPRQDLLMRQFSYGVEAFSQFASKAVMSRFDYACALSTTDVSVNVINTNGSLKRDPPPYSQQQCYALISWIKSLKPEDIVFPNDVLHYILKISKELAEIYSENVSLVVGSDIRKKVAKVAAAIAGRIFNVNDDGKLLVDERCARVAVKFLRALYDNDVMGYLAYSNARRLKENLNLKYLEAIITKLVVPNDDISRNHVIDTFMSMDDFTIDDIQVFFDLKRNEAQRILFQLTRANAIEVQKQYYGKDRYIKRVKFVEYLQDYMKGLEFVSEDV